MILTLSPMRSFHYDTLSSLNFANRTKKIEVREIENEPVFKGCTRAVTVSTGTSIQRQPLRPLTISVHNSAVHALNPPNKQGDRQAKSFSVYSDRVQLSNTAGLETIRCSPLKRPSDPFSSSSRPAKRRSLDRMLINSQLTTSKEAIEKIIEDKVTNILAARAIDQPSIVSQPDISEKVQKRLELLEKKIDGKDDGRQQGLTFLLMAKQHAVRGDNLSALRMYTLAKTYFPDNRKLNLKIDKIRQKTNEKKPERKDNKPTDEALNLDPEKDSHLVSGVCMTDGMPLLGHRPSTSNTRPNQRESGVQGGRANKQLAIQKPTPDVLTKTAKVKQNDSDYETTVRDGDNGYESDGGFHYKARTKKKESGSTGIPDQVQTPRTTQLLDIVNARVLSQIRLLRGVGAKKAEAIVEALSGADEDESNEAAVTSLGELGRLRGVGPKTVESMRMGLQIVRGLQ